MAVRSLHGETNWDPSSHLWNPDDHYIFIRFFLCSKSVISARWWVCTTAKFSFVCGRDYLDTQRTAPMLELVFLTFPIHSAAFLHLSSIISISILLIIQYINAAGGKFQWNDWWMWKPSNKFFTDVEKCKILCPSSCCFESVQDPVEKLWLFFQVLSNGAGEMTKNKKIIFSLRFFVF